MEVEFNCGHTADVYNKTEKQSGKCPDCKLKAAKAYKPDPILPYDIPYDLFKQIIKEDDDAL